MGERNGGDGFDFDEDGEMLEFEDVESTPRADFQTELGDAWASDPTLNPSSAPPIATPPPTIPAAPTQSFSLQNAVANVTNAALSILQVQQAYRVARMPTPRTVTVSGNGNSRTPNADGTVTVRDQAGTVIGREKPQVGVPYALPDGTMMLNNGNNTYTLISPAGVRTTRQYPGGGRRDTGPGVVGGSLGISTIGAALLVGGLGYFVWRNMGRARR